MTKEVQVLETFELPTSPNDFVILNETPNYVLVRYDDVIYKADKHNLYHRFNGHRLLMYKPKEFNRLAFVFYPEDEQWYTLYEYMPGLHVRQESQYRQRDENYVSWAITKRFFAQLWRKWFPLKQKHTQDSFPLAVEPKSYAVPSELVPVQPMDPPSNVDAFYAQFLTPTQYPISNVEADYEPCMLGADHVFEMPTNHVAMEPPTYVQSTIPFPPDPLEGTAI